MTAKKKKAKPKAEKFTAIKLVIHQANIVDKKHPGPYRYVITGMLVSDQPLENFPTDYQRNLVYEDVEQSTFGYSLGSMIHTALAGMKTRSPNLPDGMSMDQFLTSLREA